MILIIYSSFVLMCGTQNYQHSWWRTPLMLIHAVLNPTYYWFSPSLRLAGIPPVI